MIALPSLAELDRGTRVRVWLCVMAIDMRLGFDLLAELLNEEQDELKRALFRRQGDGR